MAARAEPLPPRLAGHRHLATWDLKHDRRAALAVQLIFLFVAVGFVAAALLLDLPLDSGWGTIASTVVTLASCLVYMWLHEATHGVLLTVFSGTRSHYALRLPYLTTGNDAFVGRRAFLVVALGPVALWGVVLLGLFAVVPAAANLTVYILSALNVAGSAGDFYQAFRVARLPSLAKLRDNGVETTVLIPLP
ncbi:DUF3267 domain-containing protein [Kineosporia sp. A_224]|uniref:DUF3267 domain-containing protein n=1 Tax=Kineosporia sp. A_224 TaxID=1962180 RepID=UPI000B4AEA3F|nr:DUF3267 domain-containing protein [Kineosporia sp. A_224]